MKQGFKVVKASNPKLVAYGLLYANTYLRDFQCICACNSSNGMVNLSAICITYLGFDCFNQSLHDHEIEANVLNGEYALQDYAEVNWFHHCKVGISLAISKDQCSELADSVSRFIQLRGGIDSLGQWDNRTMSKSSFAVLRKQYPDLSSLLMELENTSSTGPPGTREYQLILNISSGGRLAGIK